MWLLRRFFEQHDHPSPRFAFQGTVNWMRALAIRCQDVDFSRDELREYYRIVQRRQPNEPADTLAFQYLLMAFHEKAALNELSSARNPYPIVKTAIISWYYSVYFSSKSMLAASSGTDPHNHSGTAKMWGRELASQGLVKHPFDLAFTDLTPANINATIRRFRGDNGFDQNTTPENSKMALGALYSYLKGTANYEKERLEKEVKKSRDFKIGGYTNFRTNGAKTIWDSRLTQANVNFLVQAFRYRGKANYRDAIYLSYGNDYTDRLAQFVRDLNDVSSAFVNMAAHYVSRRVVADDWVSFAEDLNENAHIELPFRAGEI
jgi:hypothetical protein